MSENSTLISYMEKSRERNWHKCQRRPQPKHINRLHTIALSRLSSRA